METYWLERNENKITFSCSNEKIVDDICDYIERYIDADNYRRMIRKVKSVE